MLHGEVQGRHVVPDRDSRGWSTEVIKDLLVCVFVKRLVVFKSPTCILSLLQEPH